MTVSFFLDTLLSPNLQPILLKALIVGVLTSVCAALLGVPLVLKRYSMIGDGLSHMGFCALAIAVALGVPENSRIFVTTPLVVLAAIGLLLLSKSGKIKGDAAIAMLSTGAVALGYIIYTAANKGGGDVCTSLFGANILALGEYDVLMSVILAVIVLLLFIFLYPKIFAITFDEAFARSAGTKASFYNMVLAVLTAITVVVGMKMIGSIMISAVIVFPALSAMRLCKHFKTAVFSSALLSVLCFVSGLVLSATLTLSFGHYDNIHLPMGPSVVMVNVLCYLVCILISSFRKKLSKKRISET